MRSKTIGTVFSLLAALAVAVPAEAAGSGMFNAVIVVRHKDARAGTDTINLVTDSPQACETAIEVTAIRMAQTNIQSIYAYCMSSAAEVTREYLCEAEGYGVIGASPLEQKNLEKRKGKLHCQRAEVKPLQLPNFRDNGLGFSLDYEFGK